MTWTWGRAIRTKPNGIMTSTTGFANSLCTADATATKTDSRRGLNAKRSAVTSKVSSHGCYEYSQTFIKKKRKKESILSSTCLLSVTRFPSLALRHMCSICILYRYIAFVMPPDACSLPVVVGPCSRRYRQWYYDETRGRCLEFEYGGCQGNKNRFDSEEACMHKCRSGDPFPTPTTPSPTTTTEAHVTEGFFEVYPTRGHYEPTRTGT